LVTGPEIEVTLKRLYDTPVEVIDRVKAALK
jgi:hypothetical protein